MTCGLLPIIDKQICLLERWLAHHLAGITNPDHAQIVHRFATWNILPRLRTRAERKPITPAGRTFAGDQVRRATAFLSWLASRKTSLGDCGQADIDAWHAGHNEHGRNAVRRFLLWCTENKLTRKFMLPSAKTRQAAPLTRARRIELLRQVLTDADAPMRSRVAAGLVLLYAQPVSRIVRLTVDDIIQDEQVLIRIGDPPSPVPQPFAVLLLDYAAHRANMRTATNPTATCCSPAAAPINHCDRNTSQSSSANSVFPPALAAAPRSGSTSRTCQPRSSPTPSATTPSPQPSSPPRPVPPGADTPPAITHRYNHRELATVE
ncbi:site-specific integrase [Saccharopolyspora pogona]|uniref:hypothetical protein n=1 Tax=Saccharopolyspora pogona TaxID=333966 RepID=UPI001CC251A8|nr:hypothetical protein [Saccharopolyspora pogona]